MGYYTQVNGNFYNSDEKIVDKFVKRLAEISEDDEEFVREVFSDCGTEIKWYDIKDDIEKVVREFANTGLEFILCGEGEEQGDVWEIEFRNNAFFIREAYYLPPSANDPVVLIDFNEEKPDFMKILDYMIEDGFEYTVNQLLEDVPDLKAKKPYEVLGALNQLIQLGKVTNSIDDRGLTYYKPIIE